MPQSRALAVEALLYGSGGLFVSFHKNRVYTFVLASDVLESMNTESQVRTGLKELLETYEIILDPTCLRETPNQTRTRDYITVLSLALVGESIAESLFELALSTFS